MDDIRLLKAAKSFCNCNDIGAQWIWFERHGPHGSHSGDAPSTGCHHVCRKLRNSDSISRLSAQDWTHDVDGWAHGFSSGSEKPYSIKASSRQWCELYAKVSCSPRATRRVARTANPPCRRS